MIELFSKHPNNLELKFDTELTPIHNEDKPDLKNLGIRGTSLDELLGILGDIFLQRSEN